MLAFAGCLFLKADAMIAVDYLGSTVTHPMGVERNLGINSDDGGEYDIAVRPLEEALVRSDGNVRIPLEYLYINNSHEDVFMRYNEFSTIFRNIVMDGFPKSMIAKVRGYGMVPAGVYNIAFEIQAVDSGTKIVKLTSSFNLQFVVPVEQSFGYQSERSRINVGVSDAFAVNKKIPSEINPQIYINSNTDWVLSLKTDYLGDQPGYYYVRTISSSPDITDRLRDRVRVEEGREIVIARGKAPASNEYVTVEYSVEGKDGQHLKPGEYLNRMKYVLREDKGI